MEPGDEITPADEGKSSEDIDDLSLNLDEAKVGGDDFGHKMDDEEGGAECRFLVWALSLVKRWAGVLGTDVDNQPDIGAEGAAQVGGCVATREKERPANCLGFED